MKVMKKKSMKQIISKIELNKFLILSLNLCRAKMTLLIKKIKLMLLKIKRLQMWKRSKKSRRCMREALLRAKLLLKKDLISMLLNSINSPRYAHLMRFHL